MTVNGGFVRLGPAAPTSPVVIAVPHAGRDYPRAMLAMARVEQGVLETLEDRHADRLVGPAVAAGATAFVAQRARAWIDLNRGEREVDRTMIAPPLPAADVDETVRVRGGLGLVPRRVGGTELWRRPLGRAELDDRIAGLLRPWHAAIAAALAAARARFGVAVLLDLHSMPPLMPARADERAARLVIGDRHGASAGPAIRAAMLAAVARAGVGIALNRPYAGGRTLDEHGRPSGHVHAVQLEVDRSLYLAPGLREAGDGLEATAALVARIVVALGTAALPPALPVAAE
jgi:N-formylglutamate amidohydrolase